MRNIRASLVCFCASVALAGCVIVPRLAGQQAGAKPDAAATTPASATSADAKPNPSVQEMHLLQAGIKAFRAENFPAAAVSLQAATAINADAMPTAHAYAWLARTELHQHKIPEAEEAAKKAIELDKDLSNAQTAMAEVEFREGNLQEADNRLVSLVKSQNAMPRSYLVLANILRATANYKSARGLIEIAHKNDPDDPDIEQSWRLSMTPQERIDEWKKRLAEHKYEDEEERLNLAAGVAVFEDREKNENRGCKLVRSCCIT